MMKGLLQSLCCVFLLVSCAALAPKDHLLRTTAQKLKPKAAAPPTTNPKNTPPGEMRFAARSQNVYDRVGSRGFLDSQTPFYGSYAGHYAPMPGAFNPGMGSFPPHLDPRGFGAPWNRSTPFNLGGWPMAPHAYPIHYNALGHFGSGIPYGGPYGVPGAGPGAYSYKYGGAQATRLNYTQFGPFAFGPYGGFPSQWATPFGGNGMSMGAFPHIGMIPTSFPYGGGAPMGMGLGPGFGLGLNVRAGMGPYPMYGGGGYGGGFPFGAGISGFYPQHPAHPGVPGQPWLPGVHPTYNPMLAAHHIGTMDPDGAAMFRAPPLAHGWGFGYPHPDFDRYSSVAGSVPPPSGESKKK